MVEDTRKTALLFPGQGAQYTGMGKDFYEQFTEAREVFNKANETLGFDLASLCFQGKQEELNKTSICQPAILVTSIAILEVLKKNPSMQIETCRAACGLSLGEYTAHVAAGSMTFTDGGRRGSKPGLFFAGAWNWHTRG